MTKEIIKNTIKKIVCIISIIFVLAIIMFYANKVFYSITKKRIFENEAEIFYKNNKENIFSIDRILFFTSSDVKNKASSQTNFTIENLYTYTDMALFINNHNKDNKDNNKEENTYENTLKNLKIKNIKFTKSSTLGTQNIYYKNLNYFAKSEIKDENKIENELEFKISNEDNIDFDKPILYNNCANPITLSYINQNIKTDYTMLDVNNPITYDGSLLKRCNIALQSIDTRVAFDIEIENNKDQKFRTTIYFDIPYQNEDNFIYDGNVKVMKNVNFKFYRYE